MSELKTELLDDDAMPFGKHKGQTMQTVPVNYLHWLWHNVTGEHATLVRKYIEDNMHVLKEENEDLIWR